MLYFVFLDEALSTIVSNFDLYNNFVVHFEHPGKRDPRWFYNMSILVGLGLFNGISTSYRLFKAKTIYKCLIIINNHLSNKNLHTVTWF